MSERTVLGVAQPSTRRPISGVVLDAGGVPIVGLADRPGRVNGIEVGCVPDDDAPDTLRLRELALEQDVALDGAGTPFPFTTRVKAAIAEEECEELLRTRRTSVIDACLDPRVRIGAVEEVVDVSRARRIGPRGMAWIAGRPDHWAGLRDGMPIPARVLAEQPQLLADIYENRVLARLLDRRILPHVRRRIRELGGLKHQADQYGDAMLHGTHDVRDRMAKLWGEWWAYGAESSAVVSARIGERIEALRDEEQRIKRLTRSPRSVYGRIGRQRNVPTTLKRTNVFRGDDRYQRVGQIWEAFGPSPTYTVDERLQRQRTTAAGHAVFCRVIVLRALTCGLKQADRGAVSAGLHGSLRLTKNGAPLRIVPVYAEGDPAIIGPLLPDVDEPTLVLLTGRDAADVVWTSPDGRLTAMACSPGNVLAIEVLAVVLRRHVLGSRYLGLPPRVVARADDRAALDGAGVGWHELDPSVIWLPGPVAKRQVEQAGRVRLAELSGMHRQSAARSWSVTAAAVLAASERWSAALVCPMPACVAAAHIADAAPGRAVLGCSEGHRWGQVQCPRGHDVAFVTGPDDAEALAAAPALPATTVLGARMISVLGVARSGLAATCPRCGDRVPVPDTRHLRRAGTG